MPRHVMWAGKVTGDLYVREERDAELNRSVKVARMMGKAQDEGAARDLLTPLLDVVLVGSKPDWWTLSGWEKKVSATLGDEVSFAQSWILIPVGSE